MSKRVKESANMIFFLCFVSSVIFLSFFYHWKLRFSRARVLDKGPVKGDRAGKRASYVVATLRRLI